jgi:hypothetical protein
MSRLRVTTSAVENKYYTLWVYVCSLCYQTCNAHAPYCHPRPVWSLQFFPHFLTNDMFFEKVIEHKMCVLIFSTTFFFDIYHSRKNSSRYGIKVYCSSGKVLVMNVRFWYNSKFIDIFSKNTQVSNFMEILLMGAELVHADEQTDTREYANSRLPQFLKAPKN